MRRWLPTAVLMSLLVGLSSGCLNLSLFNRDAPENKARIDSLERRVSALESSNRCSNACPATPQFAPQFAPQGPGFPVGR